MLKVLIVEDEALMAMLLKLTLERLGYAVCTPCATGAQAIEYALDYRPDVILMDVRLAGDINGIEVLRRIGEHYHPGVIFMTGYSDPQLRAQAMACDPLAYIVKPFTPEHLLPILKQFEASIT